MIYKKYFIFVNLLLFSFCLCEISEDKKQILLDGFKDYFNNLPNQIYTYDEGSLQNTQQVDETTYQIVANIEVTEIRNIDVTKSFKCTATIQDTNNEVTVTNNQCVENGQQSPAESVSQEQIPKAQVEVTEPTVERKPVKLENEVQSDTAITSGEQFIAIPRDQPSAPCVGCASHVNPQAAGVSDLASLGVRHLDIHEPSVKHSLNNVIDVERQVQVVNGVRYVLTLSIKFNKCVEEETDNCASSKTCKITILVKPWVKLPNGANYRAILGNNCTDEWIYGDNGEVLPEPSTDNHVHNDNTDDIQVKHNTDVQSQPNQERSLTDEELKNLQDQIIPNSQFQESTEVNREGFTVSPDASEYSKQHVFKAESTKHSENSIPVTNSEAGTQQTVNINSDKKKAIDEMLDFFDFSGIQPKTEVEEVIPRVRRSYDYDLQVLSVAEEFHGIKKSLQNARFMYEMAQVMVDYLNEMDMEVKNRAVKNVIKAEEEIENLQRFVYVQASVTIPCDKVECEPRDAVNQICNGVIDSTNEKNPQILNTFCYNDNNERDYRDVIKDISLDDPVLQKLVKEALKKIESESNTEYALKINKIVSATTQVTSGRLTKLSVILDSIKCNKSVPLALRVNCTVIEQLGSKICEIIIHERHWLKERKISYTCTDRPVDMRISKSKSIVKNITVDDPKIIEMLQEAIQYLETQSDKNNKQKIVNIKSISSQLIAGFLTKIEFVVGYTNCTDENYSRDESNKCELLNNEGLRLCKAQIWDRSWIMDGRQVEVSCDDVEKSNEIEKTRKKRSIDFVSGQLQQSVNNNLGYIKLADESLKKFLHSSSSRQHYKVVKVDRANTQDVHGKLTKIEFSISPTNCVIQANGLPSLSKCDVVNPKQIFRCRSKILERVWLDKTQYFVNCNTKDQEQETKTHSNGLKEHNPNDSKYYLLAEESLQKYLNDTGNSPNHKVVRVEKVTTQIVSGLLTSMDFIISNQNEHSSKISCHSNILEKHWLGTKQYNVSCRMQEKRNANISMAQKPDNLKYMQIAVESLQKYLKYKPESHLVRVTFVDKVIKAGNITKIIFIASHAEDDDGDTICHAEFSEHDLFRSDIEVKCDLIGTVLRNTEIGKEDPTFSKYLKLADESLHKYLQTINDSELYTIMSIENVTVQWDEGIKTYINFIVSPIDMDNSDLKGLRCLSQIEEQPWLHKKHTEVNCEKDNKLYRMKRRVSHANIIKKLGGPTIQDPSKPEYKVLAEESLSKYVRDSATTTPLRVARVEKVTTQVVAGSLITIYFVVSGNQNSEIKCTSKVWDRPWLNQKEIDVSCEDDDHRVKRQLPGGQTDQDPSKPEYKVLAEETLSKYVRDSATTTPLRVLRVEKVTTQVVAGSLITIYFVVSGNQNSEIKCTSKVWDRPWLNQKEIDVSCEDNDHRVKRQLPGGQTIQDPAKPEYKVLAEESLSKYVRDSATTTPLRVLRVEKVTTQVVAGSLITIYFVVSGNQNSEIKCTSKVWDRPWLNQKEIDVSCEDDDHRVKRQLPGGQTIQDPAKPEYKVLAEESLSKYVRDSATTTPLRVLRVEKVTTQVVAGSLITIYFVVSGNQNSEIKCTSKVWDRPWLNQKEIDVSCEDDDHRVKRQLPGGQTDQDPAKPEYKVLAEESLSKYVRDSATTTPLRVLRVEKVTTQVVAGSLITIYFVVSGNQNSEIKCTSKVWDRPWLNQKEIDVSCEDNDHRVKRQLPGGQTIQDPAKPEYKVLAEESLSKYVRDSATTTPLRVLRVEKVTTQVVAGSLITIYFVVSGNQNSEIKCTSKVWDRPWLNQKEIDVSCEDDDHRVKRQLPGGQTIQDPAKPEYKVLAEESLSKYVRDSATTTPLRVLRVEKVTTQVVAGSLITIYFVVSGNQNSEIKCTSKVWDRPWLNQKEIDVSCEDDDHRVKRQLPGGQTDQDPSKPEYKVLAEESLSKYVRDSATTTPLRVLRVEKVITQVVAGSLITIYFVVSGNQNSEIKCTSKVWDRPWLNQKEIDVSCEDNDHRVKRQLPGGQTIQDPAKPEYKVLAEESLSKYVRDSATTTPLRVLRVEKVTTQVVAGSLITIYFVVSGNQNSEIKCTSKVWDRPWLNQKEIDVSCEDDDHRVKRQLPGGQTDQDPSKPEYKVLAEESLSKYVRDSATTTPLRVLRVEKVTTQVVAGSLITIYFVVSGNQNSEIKCTSKVWDRPWLNQKEIDVSCEDNDHRVKRQLPGGQTIQDPAKPEYKVLAEESLSKYVRDSATTTPLRVLRVEKVTTQVVAGSLITIYFVVSGNQNSEIKCTSKVWDRPWLNQKEIDVSCEDDDHRVKRQLPGGQTDHDPAKPEYKVLAEESLSKYVRDSATTTPLRVARVERVTTQVVAGSLITIYFVVSGNQNSEIKCTSKVWDRPWLNQKEIDVSCEDNDHRVKRQLPGGQTIQDPAKPEYKVLAEESLSKYVRDSATTTPLRVLRVEKVTTQVVAGSLITIYFVVSGNQNSEIKCTSKVWDRPWLNQKEIDVSCEDDDHIVKRQLSGGQTDQDPSKPEYKVLAEESLSKYVRDSATATPLRVARVEKVTTQVVAGSLITIYFVVSGNQNSEIKCTSKVWDRPWLNQKEIDVSCEDDDHIVKRQLPGGQTIQDPAKPEYKVLAEESLSKYVRDSATTTPLRVARVEKVTTQVVAGSLITIDFVVSANQNSEIKCTSKVWDRPWLNQKEIDVSCEDDDHRVKRQLPGGQTDQDPAKPEYKVLAEESLSKYVRDSATTTPLRVARVERVTTQVVSGSKTSIDFIVSSKENFFTCHSDIWEQRWLGKKEITVNCNINKENSRKKRELIQVHSNDKGQHDGSILRGQIEETQDPNKPEYIILAEESLRKYEKKSSIYHKVIEVKRVVTRVVSGFKYKIDFNASPTSCSANVTKLRARSCQPIDNIILYCHTEIWDRPWLKSKKIEVQCHGPDDNDFEEYGSDSDSMDTPSDLKRNNNQKYKLLAEEASEKYLTTSNRKYVHEVTEIHSVSEQIADGTITKIEYSLSPTTCLRNETRRSNDSCAVKTPLIVFHCNATIWDRPWLHIEKEIKVTCKKMSKPNKKSKRALGDRTVRQIGDDDDEIDEDITYYYADRAVQHVNDQSSSNNLHKLITIHAVQNSVQMGTMTIRMYIDIAETFCLRHHKEMNLNDCEEMDGLGHRLCLARLWPSPDDELVVRHVSVVCDDDQDFESITGLNIAGLLRLSIEDLERSPDAKYKLVHQGEPQVIPTLDSKLPFKINFIVATTNCSKDVNLDKNPFQCYINTAIPSRACHSFIWLKAETRFVRYINAKCTPPPRSKRSLSDPANLTLDNLEIQKLVTASLEKLEMSSMHRYKQRILQINSHSTRLSSGKVTTIDFDVGYTSCLKYEWVENITSCDFIEHLPRRRCVAQIWERLWINNGKNIDVNCVDDETPLESHIEFESAEMANELAKQALKHIEAKYPHPSKQKVVRIFSLEKQVVAGIHYRMKVEVGFTDCVALSEQTDCKLLKNVGSNKFCRINVWLRPWTDHPPNFRVSCDFQEGTTHDFYHQVQAEHLFYHFLTTYSPSYQNDYSQMQKRFEIFKNNIKRIHELNAHEKGTATYGVTRFADLTYEEFSSTYMGLKTNLSDANLVPMKKADIPDIKVPPNFDWREYDAVTEVKDQGSCGSCWAFSVTGNIEGQWKMQSGQLVSLSEQELVDCDKLDDGCNGGLPDNAYRAIEQMGGLELESDYPYEGVDEKCEFNKTMAKVQISSAVNITTNETGMAQWLVHNGPISIGINANAMQFYMGGISHPWKMLCNPGNLDHGVLIVGYGIKDYPLFHKQLPFWIVKNSWGKSWGEQGYYRVYRGDGTCGVNQMASSAII